MLTPGARIFFFFLMIRRPPRSTLFPYPPLSRSRRRSGAGRGGEDRGKGAGAPLRSVRARRELSGGHPPRLDRKSTRLNSSHGYISYAVFCLKKKIIRAATRFAADARPPI